MSTRRCIVCGGPIDKEDLDGPRVCLNCWACPHCGVGVECEDGEGLILESEDEVVCYPCNRSWTVEGFERAMRRKHNRVVCPTCKGVGTVSKTPAKKTRKRR